MDYLLDTDIAKNVAVNGRLFSAMLFTVNLVAFATGYGRWFALMAVLSAVPVGAACVVDQLPQGWRELAALAVYLFTASIALVSLVSFW